MDGPHPHLLPFFPTISSYDKRTALSEWRPGRPFLAAVGIQVLGVSLDSHKLVQDVVRHAPDLVICDDPRSGEVLFRLTQTIADVLEQLSGQYEHSLQMLMA